MVAAGIATATIQAQRDSCADCLTARIWPTTGDSFPEAEALKRRQPEPLDLGVAFSGGGTRSASATTGQLRGLVQNGWLEKVRYISAISGGSWAAITYTYSEATDQQLLGPLAPPEKLQLDAVKNCPDGRMAASLGAKQLPSAAFREAASHVSSEILGNDSAQFIRQGFNWLLSRRESQRDEKTYSRFIGDIFIDPIIDPMGKQASRRLFGWDDQTVGEAVLDNIGKLSHVDFLTTDSRHRPFLIVGGEVVSTEDVFSYPLLMPIEYTPIYTGVRHRFGEKFGGTYISSWAYDHLPAGPANRKLLRVHQGDSDRKFTIADVAAAAGSAPELAFLLGKQYDTLPSWARSLSGSIAGFFPSFIHVTVHNNNEAFVSGPVSHGDGGFTDNLGVMPLLARGVKNIIVFANIVDEYAQDEDLASYFEAVPSVGLTGNKLFNRVFEPDGLAAIKAQFHDDKLAGRPLVYCNLKGNPWKVLKNDFYEIKPYDGLHICWVYTHAVEAWSGQLDSKLQKLLASKEFNTFPWYNTFTQLKLDTAHVNLLADLTGWVMTDPEVIKRIRSAIPELPEPRNPSSEPVKYVSDHCVPSYQ
jgi:hypothetical protein